MNQLVVSAFALKTKQWEKDGKEYFSQSFLFNNQILTKFFSSPADFAEEGVECTLVLVPFYNANKDVLYIQIQEVY